MSSANMVDNAEIILHVWPERWSLPTFTPACLAAVLYMQLTVPGKFVLQECTNPDLSPDGQLPYLTHGPTCIASFPSIVRYFHERVYQPGASNENEQDVEVTDGNSESSAASSRRAIQTAWMAFVSANLGDLVACSFFTLRHNYYEFTRPALAEILPIPQRYYLPDRLRETYKPRLDAVGLWSVHAEEAEEEKRRKRGISVASESAVFEAFGKEKVLDKARTALDLLSNLLSDKPFFLDNPEPHALDALVAAHILLLITPPFPNDLLSSLIRDRYPSLLAHARRIEAQTISSRQTEALSGSLSSSFDVVENHHPPEHVPLRIRAASPTNLAQIVSSLTFPISWRNSSATHARKPGRSKEDREFDRMRWAWFGLAALGVAGWLWAVGLRVTIVTNSDPEEEEEFIEIGGEGEDGDGDGEEEATDGEEEEE